MWQCSLLLLILLFAFAFAISWTLILKWEIKNFRASYLKQSDQELIDAERYGGRNK